MKKSISVLAVCSVLCAFTACGQKTESDAKMYNPPEYQQKMAVSDIDIQYTTVPEQEAIKFTTTTRTAYQVELPQETTAPYAPVQYNTEYQPEENTAPYIETQYTTEYKPATTETVTSAPKNNESISISADIYSSIENYLECINNNDIYGIIKASYPERYADTIMNMSDIDYVLLEDIIGDMYKEKNMHLSGANSYETMSEDYIEHFSCLLSGIEPYRDYWEETGKSSMDYHDFIRIYKKKYASQDKHYFNITKAVKINCNISSDSEGIKERNMVLYYVDGEGWKVDTVFMPCIQSIDELKDNEFINSLNTLIIDSVDFVEKEIVDKIDDYKNYFKDFDYKDYYDYYYDKYHDYFDDYDYEDYYDDFDYYGNMIEDEVNGFLSDIGVY